MAENSAIEWTDHTFNPWEGCQKVGPGCDHCYAETRNARFGGGSAPNWGPGAPRRRTSPANWRKPLAWEAAAERFATEHGRRQRVFCASLADVFDNAVSIEWRRDLLDLIERTPSLDWLLLTKRIGNVAWMLAEVGRDALPPHVWLGATVVNQVEADCDVPKLLAIDASIRFLSIEPLLGALELADLWGERRIYRGDDVSGYIDFQPQIDWIIVGGESGDGARPMNPAWVRRLRDECADASVPFLFKQWGEWMPYEAGETVADHLHALDCLERNFGRVKVQGGIHGNFARVGKRAAGRLLDDVQHDGVPA